MAKGKKLRVRTQSDGKTLRFFLRDENRPQDGEKEVSEKEALALLNNPEPQETPEGVRIKNRPLGPRKPLITLEATKEAQDEAEARAQDDELRRFPAQLEEAQKKAADALDLDNEDKTLSPPKKSKALSRSKPSSDAVLEETAFIGLVFLGGTLTWFYTRRRA